MLKDAGILAGFAALKGQAFVKRTALLQNCSVVELRQYTLHAGARETLIALFESEFIKPQEAIGMPVFGPFCDLEDPNRFVWMRGFPSMVERKRMLAAFYGGPVWKAHSQAANATMLDSDNVLLLRPERPPSAESAAHILGNAALQRHSLLVANIHYVTTPAIDAFAEFFDQRIRPRFAATGAHIFASFQTDNAPNTFPNLPVRESETVFVWLAAFPEMHDYRQHLAALRAGPDWREHAPENLLHQFARKPEVLLLAPTPHSHLGI
jgi:hypothetical protein